MSYMTINNRRVEFTDEKNVLSVIRKSGIDLPTFCYHSELSTYGACRMCVVEDDRGRIFASCSETPRDKMVIYTNTPRLKHHRKMIIELLLASHCRDCTTCTKNGVCVLQKLSRQLGIKEVRFENNKKQLPKDLSSECIIRDPNKCILCGDCVRTCDEIQGMGILDFAFRGSKMQVTTAFNKDLAQTDCVGCGQCRAVCPTGAITIKQDIERVWEALSDPKIRVVVQIAPAVRVAVGDKFGIPKGENVLGRLVAALRRIGFDEVYDTNFGADLTVMEESKELVEQNVDYVLTTTEASRMIQESGIDLSQVEPEALDMPFGISSGAGAIFGVTGGVTEAVLRRLMNSDRAEDLEAISFTGVRGVDGIKEASVKLGDRDVKIAVVNGLKCASEVLDKIEAGEIYYDFVEVMACKRGCITGGGQPVPIGPRTKKARVEGLYKIDKLAQIKLSSQNPIVATVYDGILKGKEHKLLHNER